jgi:hypothetical protein
VIYPWRKNGGTGYYYGGFSAKYYNLNSRQINFGVFTNSSFFIRKDSITEDTVIEVYNVEKDYKIIIKDSAKFLSEAK